MILFIFAVICAYVIYINVYWIYITIMTPRKSIKDICNIAKTGDIILFKIHNIPEFYHHLITYTHVGIVIVHPITKEKYILESHQTMPKTKLSMYETSSYMTDGIHVYSLYNRLNQRTDYEYRLFHLQLKDNFPIADEKLMKFVSNLPGYMKKVPYYYDYERYIWNNCTLNKLCHKCFGFEHKSELFCSEFIGFVLKLLGILSEDFEHRCLLPGDFRIIQNDGEELYENLTIIKNI